MNVKSLTLTNPYYPSLLRNIYKPPETLYIVSNQWEQLCQLSSVAIVGSRKPTDYGKIVTTLLTECLKQSEVATVSGLAYGIDAVVHRVSCGNLIPTIAVLPCGLDIVYPRFHASLANEIIEKGGALVSEYPLGTPVRKHHFIARNRLIAGLAGACLITEATRKSGSLHTARFALECGRDVLAVPGNITAANSTGTNWLITEGAQPITCADDLMSTLGLTKQEKRRTVASPYLNPKEQIILDLLSKGAEDNEQLLRESGMDIESFQQGICGLEVKGYTEKIGLSKWRLI